MPKIKAFTAIASTLSFCFGASFMQAAYAQNTYPSKPITMIVGYPPGGSVDAVARVLAYAMEKSIGNSIVVDNAPGASGMIGMQKVVSAKPDGYTLFFAGNSEITATAVLNPTQKIKPQEDLAPIGYVGSIPMVLVTSKKSGVTDLNSFMDRTKSTTKVFTYGTSGVGSMLHFSGEMLKKMGNLSLLHVPYKGGTNHVTDLIGGNIDFAFTGPGTALPYIKSSRIIPIAVTSPKRSPLLPSVPSFSEYPSLKEYSLEGWYALLAPKNTPAPVLQSLSAALKKTLQDNEVKQKLLQLGAIAGTGNENLPEVIRTDSEKYKKIASYANMRD